MSFKTLLFNAVLSLLFISEGHSQDGRFTFLLPTAASTSAGVFKADGSLVKTLWNDVKYPAGTHTKGWDGSDDFGKVIKSPEAAYTIKVLSNNVRYTWQGTIGNTSTSMSGPSKHTGVYNCMNGLAFTDPYGYYCSGYCEGVPSIGKFLIAKPQEEIRIFTDRPSCVDTNFVATDGVLVYWGAFDHGGANDCSFVYATRVADDQNARFAAGKDYKLTYGRVYPVTSFVDEANSYITGLAVQKKGAYLFVARSGLNQLQVLDKTSGALIQTLAFPTPRALCVDPADNLWMASGANTLTRYTVNPDGTLAAAKLTLSGLLDPLAAQISPDGSVIAVADGGASQQVHFFNQNTGAAAGALGTAGGYETEAAVTDNKFYFRDSMDVKFPSTNTLVNFIAYQPDGTFWVNDPGNYRVQHYDRNKAWIDRIMSLGCTYSVWVDKNNIKRVFSDFLEFEVDYSVQTLAGSAGWKLTHNRSATATIGRGSKVEGLTHHRYPAYITTLNNGRTYGLLRTAVGNANTWEVVEFTAAARLRFTGIKLKDLGTILCADGSLQEHLQSGSTATFNRYLLTGFDAIGNPQWSKTPELLARATGDPILGNPVARPANQIFSTTDRVALFNYKGWANNKKEPHLGYHLGLMKKGAADTYLALTEKATHKNYRGPYPGAGYFDVGNNVNDYAGGNVNIVDRNIITSYHGEFWKNSQTNKFNHYYDNGLAIGQFGTTRPEVGMQSIAAPMMAGNALTPTVVEDAKGDLYVWHGDESDHAGIHRWKISGLDTIAEQVIPLRFPSAYKAPPRDYSDLTEGLPFDQTLVTHTAGWTRLPETDILTGPYESYFKVWTSTMQLDRGSPNDISVNYIQKKKHNAFVSRDLGGNAVSRSWKITGLVAYPRSSPNGAAVSQYLEIVDDAGKVLAAFYPLSEPASKTVVMKFNDKSVAPSSSSPLSLAEQTTFSIAAADGLMTFVYGNHPPVTAASADATGNWRQPKTLILRFEHTGKNQPAQNVSIDLGALRFSKD